MSPVFVTTIVTAIVDPYGTSTLGAVFASSPLMYLVILTAGATTSSVSAAIPGPCDASAAYEPCSVSVYV